MSLKENLRETKMTDFFERKERKPSLTEIKQENEEWKKKEAELKTQEEVKECIQSEEDKFIEKVKSWLKYNRHTFTEEEKEILDHIEAHAFHDNLMERRKVDENGTELFRCMGILCKEQKIYGVFKERKEFGKHKRVKYGVTNVCKLCAKVVKEMSKLTKKCHSCNKRKSKNDFPSTQSKKCNNCVTLMKNGKKLCLGIFCDGKIIKELSEFHMIKGGYRNICNDCRCNKNNTNIQECFKQMLKHMKQSKHSLSITNYKFLVYLYISQRFRCEYSNAMMNWRGGTGKYHMSIERIDDKKGYSPGNVCLVLEIFNTQSKFSPEKIKYLLANRKTPILPNTYYTDSKGKHHVAPTPTQLTQYYQEFKNKIGLNSSNQELWNELDSVDKIKNKVRNSLKRRFILSKIDSNKLSDRRQKKKFNGNICDLTPEDIIGLIWKQQGICHVSGMPFKLERKVDWKLSIERVNNDLPHIRGNVVIICSEFNCGDHSQGSANGNIGEVSQWLRDDVYELFPQTKIQDLH